MHFETAPDALFTAADTTAIPIHFTDTESFAARDDAGAHTARARGFSGKAGEWCMVQDADGTAVEVLFGAKEDGGVLDGAALAAALPEGRYRSDALSPLAWAMGGYKFTRYRKAERVAAALAADLSPRDKRLAEMVFMARDLINIPANDMGPDALEAAFRTLGKTHGADVSVTSGEATRDPFPMLHAVGRASDQGPRVLDMTWGKADAPKVTLVGKGVTFDTGGLNIKPGSSMALMKKDMGGAANVMALAHAIMDAKLPVRLRLIVGAVENAISGNAFRPGDVLPSRKGLSVEIGNTDAEGRLVLGDCLAMADEEAPEMLIDMATLTGAARVALGPEVMPFYTHDDGFADALTGASQTDSDPVWRMPLWDNYRSMLDSKIADISHINTSGTGFAGSITAALFLDRFVEQAATWAHFDIYGWVPSARPHAPVGGEAQAIRALYAHLESRFGA